MSTGYQGAIMSTSMYKANWGDGLEYELIGSDNFFVKYILFNFPL